MGIKFLYNRLAIAKQSHKYESTLATLFSQDFIQGQEQLRSQALP